MASTLYTMVEGTPAYEGDDPLAVVTAVVEGRRRPARRAGPLEPLLSDLLDRSAATRPARQRDPAPAIAVAASGDQVVDLSEPHTLVLPTLFPRFPSRSRSR